MNEETKNPNPDTVAPLILFFDTETTGLPPKYAALDDPRQPHLVQFAAMLTDIDGRVLKAISEIILPMDWDIPKQASDVHGITTELANRLGTPRHTIVEWFNNVVGHAALIVAHNADFDMKIMRAQAAKEGISFWSNLPPIFDTMKESTDLVKLPSRYGNYKWPTLMELHEFLFGEKFEGAHDALEDIRATMRCYFELKAREESAE